MSTGICAKRERRPRARGASACHTVLNRLQTAEGDSESGDALPPGRRQQANEFRDRGSQLEAITWSYLRIQPVDATPRL
jgi:hypothetical protein